MTRVNRVSVVPYAYEDSNIIGFMGTHQPVIWMGDFGYISLMPGVDQVKVTPDDRKFPFRHSDEVTTPYYYSVRMDAGSGETITGEMTATSRAGFLKFTYPENAASNITVEVTREMLPIL